MIRLLVTGGRDYNNHLKIKEVLNSYLQKNSEDLLIIQGGSNGVDSITKDWCNVKGIPCITMDAAWAKFGRNAGPIRNSWMIKYCNPTHGLVFPGGMGTKNMHNQLVEAGIKVHIVNE
jgi:hypothetical protein